MSRQTDLEASILEAYNIIRKWEKRLLDADPTEQARCKREIEEHWEKIRGCGAGVVQTCPERSEGGGGGQNYPSSQTFGLFGEGSHHAGARED